MELVLEELDLEELIFEELDLDELFEEEMEAFVPPLFEEALEVEPPGVGTFSWRCTVMVYCVFCLPSAVVTVMRKTVGIPALLRFLRFTRAVP